MISSNQVLTVLFYRSKSDLLWREFKSLRDELADQDVAVDLVTYFVRDVAIYRQFKLDSIPIVKIFHGSRGGVTFKGPVSVHNLATWISYYQHSAVAKVETIDEYHELEAILQTFMVGAFAELGALYGTFHEAALYDEIPFVATTNLSLAEHLNMPIPSIVMSKDEGLYSAARRSEDIFNFNTKYAAQATSAPLRNAGERPLPELRRSFNRTIVPYSRNLSCVDSIDSFVLHNQLPSLVVEYGIKTARKLFDTTYSRFVLLFAFEGTSSLSRLLDTFHTIAGWLETREGGSMRQIFVHVPSYQSEAWAFFGVHEEDSPAVVFYETVRGGPPVTGPGAHGALVPGVHDKLLNVDTVQAESLIGFLRLDDDNDAGKPTALNEFSLYLAALNRDIERTAELAKSLPPTPESIPLGPEFLYSPPFQPVTQTDFEPHVLDPTHDVLVFFCRYPSNQDDRVKWGAFLLIMLQVARLFEDVESLNVVLVWSNPDSGDAKQGTGSDGLIETSIIPKEAQEGLVLFPAYNKVTRVCLGNGRLHDRPQSHHHVCM